MCGNHAKAVAYSASNMLAITYGSLKCFVVLCWRDVHEDYVWYGLHNFFFYIRERSDDDVLYCHRIFAKITDNLVFKTADTPKYILS